MLKCKYQILHYLYYQIYILAHNMKFVVKLIGWEYLKSLL